MEPQATTPRHNSLLFLGAGILILVVVAYAAILVLGSTREAQRGEVDNKLSVLETKMRSPQIAAVQSQYSALDIVRKQLKDIQSKRFLFAPLWKDIKASVPKDMQFQNLIMSSDGTFRVSGITRSVTSVSHFATALAQKPTIEAVQPLSVDKGLGSDVYTFTVTFRGKRGVAQ